MEALVIRAFCTTASAAAKAAWLDKVRWKNSEKLFKERD